MTIKTRSGQCRRCERKAMCRPLHLMKVARAGRKAVINIKLGQEGGKMIFSVKNPVAEKVQIADGIVLDSNGGMHGVSLMGVRAVVDKYGGFAISCDQEKFQAVELFKLYGHSVQKIVTWRNLGRKTGCICRYILYAG